MGVPERRPQQDGLGEQRPLPGVHDVLAGETRRKGGRLRQVAECADAEARGDGDAGSATCYSDVEDSTGREGQGADPDVSPCDASRGA